MNHTESTQCSVPTEPARNSMNNHPENRVVGAAPRKRHRSRACQQMDTICFRPAKSEPTISSKMCRLRYGCDWHCDCTDPWRNASPRRKRDRLLRLMRLLPLAYRVGAKMGAPEDLRSNA